MFVKKERRIKLLFQLCVSTCCVGFKIYTHNKTFWCLLLAMTRIKMHNLFPCLSLSYLIQHQQHYYAGAAEGCTRRQREEKKISLAPSTFKQQQQFSSHSHSDHIVWLVVMRPYHHTIDDTNCIFDLMRFIYLIRIWSRPNAWAAL